MLFIAGVLAPCLGAAERPGKLVFFGSSDAELFSKEIDASLRGVLTLNYVATAHDGYPAGFLRASPAPQSWYQTMWTRDAGTFLRELVAFGYYEHAAQVARCILSEAPVNSEGFVAFSRFFSAGSPSQPGAEIDGQAAIIISLVSLWQRLPPDDPFRADLYRFLHQPSSPVRYFHHVLEHAPLIAGSGEFGGGAQPFGLWDNVVQNNLSALALLAAAEMEDAAGDSADAERWREDAHGLFAQIQEHLIGSDGAWIWCIDRHTLKPDQAILGKPVNVGFGGLNGVACMDADVLGFDPHHPEWPGLRQSERSFDKLLSQPARKAQFEKYGIWTQFDVFSGGFLTSPSYGQGYAIQTMLLLDRLALAGHALHFLADATFHPGGVNFEHGRLSPYYFYERLYSPDAVGRIDLAGGCGPLNLVNVTEPLKAARLIAGVDDTSLDEVRILPRLPPGWSGYRAEHWPIRTSAGMVWADLSVTRMDNPTDDEAVSVRLRLETGQRIPRLAVRLPGRSGPRWVRAQDVDHFDR